MGNKIMTYDLIDFGASENDPTADTYRTGFGKVNTMYQTLYGVGSAANQVWGTGATYNTTGSGGWITLTSDHLPSGISETKLESNGVTAGEYGSGGAVPIITVDAKGLITEISILDNPYEMEDMTNLTLTNIKRGDILQITGTTGDGTYENIQENPKHIETQTITTGGAVTEVIFTGDFSAYHKLILRISKVTFTTTAAPYLFLVLSNDSGVTWLSTYYDYTHIQHNGSSIDIGKDDDYVVGTLTPYVAAWAPHQDNQECNLEYDFYNLSTNSPTDIYCRGVYKQITTGNMVKFEGAITQSTNNIINGIRAYVYANSFDTATFELYGEI